MSIEQRYYLMLVSVVIIWYAVKISKQLSLIIKNQKTVMATLAEVQQALTDLQASVDAKQQAIADAIAALEAQIAAGVVTPADLQGIVDSLKSTQADVDSTPTA